MGTIVAYNRWRVSDALWAKMEALIPLPPKRDPLVGGRPRVPARQAMDGILFVARTGCQWNALNATGICSSSTAHLRFQEWTQSGVFLKLWEQGLIEYDDLKGLEWRWQSMDGAMTKAPLGGGKNRPQPHRQGQGRREAQSADGRSGSSNRDRHRRGEPERLQDGAGNARQHPDRSAEAHAPRSARAVLG